MAVNVQYGKDYGTGDMDAQFPRPRLQRRPGSFNTGASSHQQGSIYSAGSGSFSPSYLHPDSMATTSQDEIEESEPTLLPFVEARLIHVVSRSSGGGSGIHDQSRSTSSVSGKDVVVGFGNWIKIVRLQDEDSDEVGHGNEGPEHAWS